MSGLDPKSWFPRTKLYPPNPGDDILERPQLVARIYQAAMARRLTLLAAPAGSGKTTLAAAAGRMLPESCRAWLRLDADDNDPATFFYGLAEACRQVCPGCGQTAELLLHSQPNSAGELTRLVGVLVNGLLACQPEPFLLVLDDLHHITSPDVHRALDYLLECAPPGLHLLVTSRHEPQLTLARLRARGELAEFYLPDLRFSGAETGTLFNDRLRLNLSHTELETLQQYTGGWVAALKLLSASLASINTAAERTRFIRGLSRTSRHIFDLLAAEVLNRQPPHLRTFLLETSILGELTPHLATVVTGRADAPALLETVYRRNLFLTALTGDETVIQTTYHYHALFADFLRHSLSLEAPDRVAELHRRAARAVDNPAQAMCHYLAAEMWPEAARLVERHGPGLLQRGRLNTLENWLEALPPPEVEARPWLRYFKGACLAQRGRFSEAEPFLLAALHKFESAGDQAGQIAALGDLSFTANSLGQTARAGKLLDRVLEYPLPPFHQTHTHMGRAWVAVYQNDWPRVSAELRAAIQVARESGERGAYTVLGYQLRGVLCLADDTLELLHRYGEHVLARFGYRPGVAPAGACCLLALLNLLQGNLEQAKTLYKQAAQMSRQVGGLVYVDVEIAMVHLMLALWQQDYALFEHEWREQLPKFKQTGDGRYYSCYLNQLARVYWLQNRLNEAGELYTRMQAAKQSREVPENKVARLLAGAMLDISRRDFSSAETLLQKAVAMEQAARQSLVWGNARILLAHLYRLCGRPDDALATFRPVLNRFEAAGLPGLCLVEGSVAEPLLRLAVERDVQPAFARRALDLLAGAAEPRSLNIPGTADALTPREVEVLRLIVSGASNSQIAEELVISLYTVKSHVTRILSKLNVSSRTRAAARARELGLV